MRTYIFLSIGSRGMGVKLYDLRFLLHVCSDYLWKAFPSVKATVGRIGTSGLTQERMWAELARGTGLTGAQRSTERLSAREEGGWKAAAGPGDRAASEADTQRTAVAVRRRGPWLATYCWRCGVSLTTAVLVNTHRPCPEPGWEENQTRHWICPGTLNLGIFLKISFPWTRNEDRWRYVS